MKFDMIHLIACWFLQLDNTTFAVWKHNIFSEVISGHKVIPIFWKNTQSLFSIFVQENRVQ